MRFRYAVIFTILLPAATLAPLSARQADATKSGSLEGFVIDARNGEPIADAQIRLSGGPIDPAAYERLKTTLAALLKIEVPPPDNLSIEEFIEKVRDLAAANGKPLYTTQLHAPINLFRNAHDSRSRAQSDSKGRFTIKNLPPGLYAAQVQRDGYFGIGLSANIVTVVTDQTASVNLTMTSGGTITGRVTSNGQPYSGVMVHALGIKYRNGYPILQSAASRNTDDRGEYRLFNLPPGDYLVAVTPRNMPVPTVVDTTQSSAAPARPSAIAPVEQALRTFYPGTVDRTRANSISIRDGREAVGIDISVKTSALYRVSGEVRVFVPPSALATTSRQGEKVRAEVRFSLRDPNTPDDDSGLGVGQELGGGQIMLQPNGDIFIGTFQANNIPPGSYDWKAFVYETGGEGSNRPTAIVPVDVRGADVEGLRLDVYPTVTVKGIVTVDGAAPGANKAPLWLQTEGASARRPGYKELASRVVLADENTGAFSISGVPMGRFRVMVGKALPPKLYLADVRSGEQSVFDPGFDVGAGEPPPIQVLLRSGAGSVSGTVRDGNKKPVAGAVVALVPALPYRENRARFYAATADAGAGFSIASVAPGEYEVFAFPATIEKQEVAWREIPESAGYMRLAWREFPNGAYFNSAFLARFEGKGLPVTIAAQSATVKIDLTVIAEDNQ